MPSSSRSSGPGELCSVFRRAWKSYSLRHSWSPGGSSSCDWGFKKSVPSTDSLWMAGVDLKSSWGFCILLVRLEVWDDSVTRVCCGNQSVSMVPFRGFHSTVSLAALIPPLQNERYVPLAQILWRLFFCVCAQVEAEDSLPAVAFPYSLLSVVLVFLVLGPERILSIWVSSHSQRYRHIIPRC